MTLSDIRMFIKINKIIDSENRVGAETNLSATWCVFSVTVCSDTYPYRFGLNQHLCFSEESAKTKTTRF